MSHDDKEVILLQSKIRFRADLTIGEEGDIHMNDIIINEPTSPGPAQKGWVLLQVFSSFY